MVVFAFVLLAVCLAMAPPVATQASVLSPTVLALKAGPAISGQSIQTASAVSPGVSLVRGNAELDLFSGAPLRMQQVYDYDSFWGSTSVVIHKLRYRVANGKAVGNLGGHRVDLALWMCYAPQQPLVIDSKSFSRNFQENLDSKTLKQVFKRKSIQLPILYVPGFAFTIPLDAQASYALVRGLKRSLVVETRFYGNASGSSPWYPLDALDTATLGQGSITANTNYQGCLSASLYPVWHASHSTRLKVGNRGFFCTGDVGIPVCIRDDRWKPGDLSPIPGARWSGMPCKIVNDILFVIPGITDVRGIFVAKMPIAADPKLSGQSFYSQMLFFELGANALGVTASNGIGQVIGPGNPWPGGSVGIGYARTLTVATTPDAIIRAQVRDTGVGLVTQFDN